MRRVCIQRAGRERPLRPFRPADHPARVSAQLSLCRGNGKKEVAVIDSVLKQYPLGLLYFNRLSNGQLEVLDGQQRITSLGRFLTDKFSVMSNELPYRFHALPKDKQTLIENTQLLVYECEGTESEINQWFQTINISGIPLNEQEELNAVYSGPFVTKAREVFSNSRNANVQK